MRMMLKVSFSTEAGNQAIRSGTLPRVLEKLFGDLRPEATYFTAEHGERTAFIFFDMKESAQMPVIAEPLFQELGARISLTPAMNADDLKRGLAAATATHR